MSKKFTKHIVLDQGFRPDGLALPKGATRLSFAPVSGSDWGTP